MKNVKTLCIDIGGTGIKALVVDSKGEIVPGGERVREETPRPATPESVMTAIAALAGRLGSYERVSVGFPGVVEDGTTRTAPNLDEGWADFALAQQLEQKLGAPVRVANDAGVQGLGAIEGMGTEIVVTLGTGMGFGLYIDGRYVPNIELGHHPFRKGMTYEERVGEAVRAEIGNRRWKRRVHQVIAQLRHTFNFRVLYLGGGNARHLDPDEFVSDERGQIRLVDNIAGLLGGLRLWEPLTVAPAAERGENGGAGETMNDWFDIAVPLDASAAATIARGMREVAREDGVLHQRELNLIAAFEADLPENVDATGVLPTETLRLTYLRSLITVALADGVISDAEMAKIKELSAEQSIAPETVEEEVLSVKRRFLSVFAGVTLFRDSVVRVARDLGLPDSEVDALSQEA